MSRKASRATKRVPQESFFDRAMVEAPHADAVMAKKLDKRRRLGYVVIVTCLVAVPVFAVVSMNNFTTISELSEREFPAQVSIDTPAKHTAIAAVEQWLKSSPSPLPTGYILSWDGAVTQQEERTFLDEDGKEAYEHGVELHRFTLSTASGAMFTTEVQVAYGEADGSGVLGAPTLMPVAPSNASGFISVDGWQGTMPGTTTEAMTEAVNGWVKAFTSGDPSALRLAVGDTRDNVSYVPLTGILDTGTVSVGVSAVKPVDAGLPKREWVADPAVALVRVSFPIAWPGQLDKPDADVQNLGRITYDLLVEDADTAAPKIVAWGSAGTGASLEAFQNAVVGKITADGLNNSGDSITDDAQEVEEPTDGAGDAPTGGTTEIPTDSIDAETETGPDSDG